MALDRSRGVVLIGPRPSGKSTLAQQFLSRKSANYFDLEYPPHAMRLEQPVQTLEASSGLVVIDEVQLKPALFPLLRVLIDRSDAPGQFLLLGSASPTLLSQAGESLLGRVETIDIGGFKLREVSADQDHGHGHCDQSSYSDDVAARLWLRGGFPRSFLAATDADSMVWRGHAVNDHCVWTFRSLETHCRARHAAVLDHAGSLSWANLVGRAIGSINGRVRAHNPPLPG